VRGGTVNAGFEPKAATKLTDFLPTDFDTTFVPQVVNVPERKWKTNLHHCRQACEIGADGEIVDLI
jgi:hypothetical protein